MLARYDYTDDQNFYLERLDYGNEDSVQYEYDDKGRILSATYEDTKTVEYTYDNSGRTATISDEASGTVSSFGYDYMDRVSVYTEENSDNKLTLSYSYYVANKKLKTLLEEINGHPRGASYVYDNDERLESYQKANGKRKYNYDVFDRVPSYVTTHKNTEGEFVTVLTTAFTFASSEVSTTSARVASMTQEGNGFTQSYSYTYDKNGNILSVSDPNGTTTYEYDSTGQLLRENNFAGNFTHVWVYDEAGNIESRTEYAYTTGELGAPINTVDYSYGDAEWGDLLTKYGDLEIKYDKIGNPESIGTSTLTWQHGRQLASLTSGETTWTYTYNADGLRTKRTDGTNIYEYVYYGGLLQYMEYNNTPVYFTHAPDGTPMGMLTDGEAYFYITNLQGDVVGIVDATGNLLVSYTYDAWGNPLTTTFTNSSDPEVLEDAANVAAINPLRYRGYVYDTETGLYYLQSRHYDPEIGRFINADDFGNLGIDDRFASCSLFVYCGNNPIAGFDPAGNWDWGFVAKAVVTVAVVAVCLTGVGAIAAAAATVAATSVTTAVTSAVVAAGVSTVCGAVDGAICAAESGGDWRDGLMAGAIGGSVGTLVSSITNPAPGTDGSLRMNTLGRAASSLTYDLTYEYFSTGTVKTENLANHAVDVVSDVIVAPVCYDYTAKISNNYIRAKVNGIIDGIIDVFQTRRLFVN